MQHDFERVGVCSDDDEFCDAAVESFGGFVGSFFDLLEGGTLGYEVVDG